jgi:hypothetical protein
MAKISTYVIDGTIVDGDKVIGSDANNDMITKNYTIGDLVNYFAFQIGSNYLVPYLNANNNVDLGSYNLTANDLIATNQVIIGGTAGLSGQVLTSQGPGSPAIWAYNAGSQDLQGVLGYGNTANLSIFLDNPTGSALLDIDKVYGDASIILDDKTNSNTSRWYPNLFHLEDNSIGRELNIYSNEIEFYNGTNTVSFKPTSYSNQNFLLPNVGGAFVMSVNGVYADMSGAVTIPTGGGSQDLQQVTDLGNTTTNSIIITDTNEGYDLYDGVGGQYTKIRSADGGVSFKYDTDALPFIEFSRQGSGITNMIFGESTFNKLVILGNNSITAGRSIEFPNQDCTLVASVNGNLADAQGNITISVGTVTGVTATAPLTSSGGTAPNISTSMNTNKLIGRSTAGVGVMEEISVGTGLSLSGGTLSATAQVLGFEQHFLLMGA